MTDLVTPNYARKQNKARRFLLTVLAGVVATLGLLAVSRALLGFGPTHPFWLGYLVVAAQGFCVGLCQGRVAKTFPAFAGVIASLQVVVFDYVQAGCQIGLENIVSVLVDFECHFAALYLGAYCVFLARGGGVAYPRFIGMRYMRYKMITSITVIGVALGVGGLIVVLSVMSGFEDDLKNKIIGANAHAIVQKSGLDFVEYRSTLEKIKRVDSVLAASPFVFVEVMVRSKQRISGVFLKGIDPASAQQVQPLKMTAGRFLDLADSDVPGILLGSQLARDLDVHLSDAVSVLSPATDQSVALGPTPVVSTYQVVGIFHTGMYEFDAKSVYVSLKNAQSFYGGLDSVTGIGVRFKDGDKTQQICDEIISTLDGYPYFVRTWHEMNRNLFSALKLQKIGMFIVLVIVILVSAFGVISTLIMLVWEKIKEIAILKSMGATTDGVMKIFMLEGIAISGLGTGLGLVLGLSVCLALHVFGMRLDPEVYYIDRLPVLVNVWEILLVTLVSIHICFIATIYPSRRAARLRPVDGLRYD